jgi:diguanylate cyclase (GGDEF)-like protein
MNESCYGIWNSEQKCINCSSARACKTGCHQEKAEHFKDDVYFIQSNPVSLKLADGSAFPAVVELVTVEKESKQAANDREAENIGSRASHYRAHHDSLTNVLNSDAFYELSRRMISNKADMSWMMITSNIMNFRLVNNLFGELKGNEVLVKTASMLQEISEASRGLCGRLGSDQFALLIPKAKYQEESLLNLEKTLERTFSSGIFTFCIHFGVYEIDDPSIPVSVMCGRANSALRTIREDMTRTVAYFDHAILQKILLEQKVIGGFDEALKDGQFRMYLQPLVDRNGGVIGGEALVRWCMPDGTIVMPGDFIETLENAGLIQKLDMYIWELAVRQLSKWKTEGREKLTISVNMSARDFYSIDVYDVLTGLVDRYGVDSRMLRLEITETALLVDPDKSDGIVSKLRENGFLVEIDDFGKGYSSLSLLKNIEADVLKIDMGFLREIRDSERSRIILKSIICLAESLGMDVITEGVETEQQLRVLSEMGCSYYQGYYFSRPVPVDEFETKFVFTE